MAYEFAILAWYLPIGKLSVFDLMSWDLKSNEIDELDFYERQRFRVVIVTEIVYEVSNELFLLVCCCQW